MRWYRSFIEKIICQSRFATLQLAADQIGNNCNITNIDRYQLPFVSNFAAFSLEETLLSRSHDGLLREQPVAVEWIFGVTTFELG